LANTRPSFLDDYSGRRVRHWGWACLAINIDLPMISRVPALPGCHPLQSANYYLLIGAIARFAQSAHFIGGE